jgi:hypothetical protein
MGVSTSIVPYQISPIRGGAYDEELARDNAHVRGFTIAT